MRRFRRALVRDAFSRPLPGGLPLGQAEALGCDRAARLGFRRVPAARSLAGREKVKKSPASVTLPGKN